MVTIVADVDRVSQQRPWLTLINIPDTPFNEDFLLDCSQIIVKIHTSTSLVILKTSFV